MQLLEKHIPRYINLKFESLINIILWLHVLGCEKITASHRFGVLGIVEFLMKIFFDNLDSRVDLLLQPKNRYYVSALPHSTDIRFCLMPVFLLICHFFGYTSITKYPLDPHKNFKNDILSINFIKKTICSAYL